jgi:nucleoside-diphosphate-sugar epimerase
MIFGSGLIGSAFQGIPLSNEWCVIACGVSNSSESSFSEFEREEITSLRILKENPACKFLYFSSCGVENANFLDTPYYRHKLKMENHILNCSGSVVVRLPQIVGASGNKNTIINKFAENIKKRQLTKIQKSATRYYIEVNDMVKLVHNILLSTPEMEILTIANPYKYSALETYEEICDLLSISDCLYELEEGGVDYDVNVPEVVLELADYLNLGFSKNYLKNALSKYKQNL